MNVSPRAIRRERRLGGVKGQRKGAAAVPPGLLLNEVTVTPLLEQGWP